ncbi:MAG: hypothetical protein IT392_12590 [Nitrospirae bacterium]|nr:hypothetical protein [Nitrospirota bacterium]
MSIASKSNEELSCTIADNLVLRDPFMIASSHYTESESSFEALAPFSPAALTLKTVSNKSGGAGKKEEGLTRDKVILCYPEDGNRLGSFSDGPKRFELWDTPSCFKNIQTARRLLPDTKLGLSVAEGESYDEIAKSFDLSLVDYVELNWKYTFRNVDFIKRTEAMLNDLEMFFKAFNSHLLIVKIPYELMPYLEREELRKIYELLYNRKATLLLLNTKKCIVPPSRQEDNKKFRDHGVIFGDHLFLDTFNVLMRLTTLRQRGWTMPRLLATGGITDIGAVVDVMAAGAEAVQLCSALDYRRIFVLEILRRQLRQLIKEADVKNLEEFKNNRLRAENHEYWLSVANRTRELETHHTRVKSQISGSKSQVIEIFERTIQFETLAQPPDSSRTQDVESLPESESVVFLINRSNIVAFILSHRVLREYRFSSEAVDGAADIRKKIIENEPEFDLAIIPDLVANAILENQKEDAVKPFKIIGSVGYSIIEVVGVMENLDSIHNLFHFGGTGSLEALKKLLPRLPINKLDLREIKRPQELSPLLAFWSKDDAILARGPLTQLYALLTDKKTKKKWKAVHQLKTDLVLVASSRFLRNASDDHAKSILGRLCKLSYEANHDAKYAAREAYDLGYMNHVANLLGASVLA